MMKLADLPFGQLFYWKGRKWKAVISPKNPPKRAYKIVCAEHPQGEWLDMPSGRKVKPIVRVKNDGI